MCRLYAFHANEPTKVECSLVLAQNSLLEQSRSDALGRAHSDGWGIAYYPEKVPVVEKHPAAAHAGLHFSAAAERVYARTVVAHVRLATVGQSTLANCHPFQWNNWIFAHNGTVTGVASLRKQMLEEIGVEMRELVKGDTDSELLFFWLMSRLQMRDASTEQFSDDLAHSASIIAEAILELDRRCATVEPSKPAKLNTVLTNGRAIIATRLRNTLYWVTRDGLHDCEVCGIPHVHHSPDVPYHAVVIASEPISHELWQEIPDGSIVTVSDSLETTLSSLSQAKQTLQRILPYGSGQAK